MHSQQNRGLPLRLLPTIGLLFSLAGLAASGSPRRPHSPEEAGRFRITSDIVLVNATVVDAAGRPVEGLTQDHFRLFEYHTEAHIAYFGEEETPVSLVIVADTSGSMKGKLNVCARAAAELFRSILPDDEFALVTFAGRPLVAEPWTTDDSKIRSALASAPAAGTTALFDAVQLGAQYASHGRNARKAVLVVSDGGDNHSRYSEGDVRRRIEELDLELYALNIGGSWFSEAEGWWGRAVLERLCEHASGRYVAVERLSELPAAVSRISREIRSQYLLRYRPRRLDGAGCLHKVEVKVIPPDGMRRVSVRWRQNWREPN
jgi:Ca-activated chloride channel family protein